MTAVIMSSTSPVVPSELPPAGKKRQKLLELVRNTQATLYKNYQEALKAGHTQDAEHFQHSLLTSFPSKFCAALAVAQKTKKKKGYSIEQCFAAAKSLNLFTPINETVNAFCVEKNGGKAHRVILDFELRYRTAHRMVERVLAPHFKPRPFQYTHRSVDKAILRARSLVTNSKTWVAVIDIVGFYNNFELDLLKQGLPLPHEVADCAVSGRHIEATWTGPAEKFPLWYLTELTPQIHRGLPTGASSSSLIAPMICSRLDIPSHLAIALVNYGDDFWIVGSSEAEVTDRANALIAAIEKLPGGYFTARKKISRVRDGARYLGYLFAWSEGKLVTTPSERNWNRLFRRLNDIHFESMQRTDGKWVSDKEIVIRLCAKQDACIQSFIAAFSAATHLSSRTIEAARASLEMDLEKVGASWSDLKKIKVSEKYSRWENPSEFY